MPNHFYLCLTYTLLGRDQEARVERGKCLALAGGRKPVVRVIWLEEEVRLRTMGLVKLAGLGDWVGTPAWHGHP